MNQPGPRSFHAHFCATRSLAAAVIFVVCCAVVLATGWRVLGRSPEVGTFTHLYAILGGLFCLVVFKCVRERVVFGLWLLSPTRALFFAAVPSLGNWSSFAYRVDLAASAVALVVSISMLMFTLRGRNQPPDRPPISGSPIGVAS